MAPFTLLFICIGNSCRSPMAEAMARALGADRVDARSAGLTPAGWIAEPTVSTLAALGYPTDGLRSKSIDEVEIDDVDVVVSLLGEETLDLMPRGHGARREAWSIRDPFGEDEETYLAVARELETRVRRLLEEHQDGELLLP